MLRGRVGWGAENSSATGRDGDDGVRVALQVVVVGGGVACDRQCARVCVCVSLSESELGLCVCMLSLLLLPLTDRKFPRASSLSNTLNFNPPSPPTVPT